LKIKETLRDWLYWLFPSLEYEEKRKRLDKFFQKKKSA
jgi:hypothetical protein